MRTKNGKYTINLFEYFSIGCGCSFLWSFILYDNGELLSIILQVFDCNSYLMCRFTNMSIIFRLYCLSYTELYCVCVNLLPWNTRIPAHLQLDIHLTKLGFVSYVCSVTVMRDCGLLRLVKCDVIILSSVFVIGLVSLV